MRPLRHTLVRVRDQTGLRYVLRGTSGSDPPRCRYHSATRGTLPPAERAVCETGHTQYFGGFLLRVLTKRIESN